MHTALAVIFVVTLALSAGVALIVANFDRTLQDVVDSRFEYIAKELKSDIEKGLDLGLALKEFSNAQQIIDQELARNEALEHVFIKNADGEVLFSAKKSGNLGQNDRHREVNAALINTFGQKAGRVSVIYATSGALNAVKEILLHLSLIASLMAVGAAFIAALACIVIMRRIPQSLLRARRALDNKVPLPDVDNQIEQASTEVVAVSKATLDELGAILVEGPSSGKREQP